MGSPHINREYSLSVLSSPKKTSDIVAIVVTYNRKNLLKICLKALLYQEIKCDIILVDNASTDGTREYIKEQFCPKNSIHYIKFGNNIGGAGGFHYGMKYALVNNWQWFWLMDDDAMPRPDALANLERFANDTNLIYASTALGLDVDAVRLCWPLEILRGTSILIEDQYQDLSKTEQLSYAPFLGFFIHKNLVEIIGLPDLQYFIHFDDVEYCERAKKSGSRIILVKDSIIHHPVIDDNNIFKFGRFYFSYRNLPTWKVYYNTRNKILVARKYFLKKIFFITLPGVFLRILISFLRRDMTFIKLQAYAAGIIDGLTGTSGKKGSFH